MDQDMRKWIEQQRRLAREGKLPKERLDVLALVDVPFERSCREEKGMAVDEDEEEEEVQDLPAYFAALALGSGPLLVPPPEAITLNALAPHWRNGYQYRRWRAPPCTQRRGGALLHDRVAGVSLNWP